MPMASKHWFIIFSVFCGYTIHHTAKVSEEVKEVNKLLPAKNTAVQLLTLYTNPKHHNA